MTAARPAVPDEATDIAVRLLRDAAGNDAPGSAVLAALSEIDDPETLRQVSAALVCLAAQRDATGDGHRPVGGVRAGYGRLDRGVEMSRWATPPRPQLVAGVGGFNAFVAALVFDDQLPARMVPMQRQVERGDMRPETLAGLGQMWADVHAAARQWVDWRSFADGRSKDPLPEMPPESASEIDTATAAQILGVTPTRVTQLARCGALGARHCGGRWLVSRTDVEIRRSLRGSV